MKLNAEKCIFKATSIPFFGHVISRERIKPDPKKIEAVKTMTTPMSKSELQSFLGLCNYLAIYVPSLSAVLQPLRELTKKNTDFQWNSQYESLYQHVPKITLWKTIKHCVITTQTSQFQLKQMLVSPALGAVLLQNGRSISFMSKALTRDTIKV